MPNNWTGRQKVKSGNYSSFGVSSTSTEFYNEAGQKDFDPGN